MQRLVAALMLVAFSGIASGQGTTPDDKAKNAAPGPAASASQRGMMGPGGPGPRGRMMRFNEKNTPGWSLMTPEERIAHRDKMHGFKTVDECKAYHDEHLKQMQERAKEQGRPAQRFRGDPCGTMMQRGYLK